MMSLRNMGQAPGGAMPAAARRGLSLQDMGRAGASNPVSDALQRSGVPLDMPGVQEAMAIAEQGDLQGAMQALSQSDLGATDGGIMLIEQLSQQLGMPSPYPHQGNAPDYAMPPKGE
jgi:hypothetical protein